VNGTRTPGDGGSGPAEVDAEEMRPVRLAPDEPPDDHGAVAAGQRVMLLQHDLAAEEPRGG
jgi:hypothetical protein